MTKVRITVIKKLDRDVIHAGTRLNCSCKGPPVCPLFEEGTCLAWGGDQR